MNKSKHKVNSFLWLCLFFAFLFGCTSQVKNPPLKFTVIDWPGFYPIYYAKTKGFFDREGVEVDLILCENNPEMNQLLINHEIDGTGGVYSDYIKLVTEGNPVSIVYVADYSDSSDVIISKSAIDSIPKLKGMRVGVEEHHSFSHLFVLSVLKSRNISESDIIFKSVPAQEVLNWLESDKIDAGHTWDPTLSKALTKGYRVLAKAGDVPGSIIDVLGFRNEVLEKRPMDVQKFVTAISKAQEAYIANMNSAFEATAQFLDVEVDYVKSSFPGVQIVDLEGNKKAFKDFSDPMSLYHSGKFILAQLKNKGLVRDDFNVEEVFSDKFIHAKP